LVITKKIEKGIQILSVVGTIDLEGKDYLANELESILFDENKGCILDLAGVDYIGSIGVSTILNIYRQFQKKNRVLCIVNLLPHLKTVFEITKLDKIIKIYENTDNAIHIILNNYN